MYFRRQFPLRSDMREGGEDQLLREASETSIASCISERIEN